MLFHKSIVSLVAAIALASGVTASATPLRRTNPHSVSPSECTANNDHLTCCDSTSSFYDQTTVIQGLLRALVPNLNLDLLVGANCVLSDTVACGTQQSTCCKGVQNQSGLVNVGFNCMPIAL